MITKVLASAVIAAGVGVVVAAPAIADPYECRRLDAPAFCGLSQSAPSQAGPAVPNQIHQGIQNGLADLHGAQSHQ